MVAAEEREWIIFCFPVKLEEHRLWIGWCGRCLAPYTNHFIFFFFFSELGQAEQIEGSPFTHQGLNLDYTSENKES